MAVSLESFAAHLAESGIVSDSDVSALRARFGPADVETFARLLVRHKLLTAYQAQQVYAGKGKGLVLGNYEILDKLGQGGMGMVLKARHRRMNRVVALKVLSPKLVKTADLLARFHREVQAAARLDHPNIVTAFDADEANGTHFFVMQFVDGGDLASIVKKRGPLSIEQAVSCVTQVARGLEYAHRHGVIHRDIKPANLLLDQDGTVKILDMGLARIEGETGANAELTTTGAVMGTVDYIAPEQAMSTRNADGRSDIYSLGATFWYLLAGRPLFGGESLMARLMAHANSPIPSLLSARTDATASLDAVYRKMIAKSPADRFQSMTEVLAALETCQQSGATVEAADTEGRREAGAANETAVVALARPSEDSKLNDFLGLFGAETSSVGRPHKAAKRGTDSGAFDMTAPAGGEEATTDPETLATLRNKALGRSSVRLSRPRWWQDRQWQMIGAAAAGGAAVTLVVAAALLLFRDREKAASGPTDEPSVPLNGTASAPRIPPKPPKQEFQFGLAGGHISTPLQIDLSGPLTLEAWITPSHDASEQQTSLYGLNTINLRGGREWSMVIWTEGPTLMVRSGRAPIADVRTHVAAVYTPTEARLYVNGKEEAHRDMTDVTPISARVPFEVGWELTDTLDEIRVSSIARYTGNFTPPSTFQPDSSTLLLYNLNEGAGDHALDSSGAGRHGTITDSNWVRVPLAERTSPAAEQPDDAK